MASLEKQYLALMRRILDEGRHKPDRTRTGTRSVFGVQLRQDIACGFPLLTTKVVWWRAVVEELAWFLSGRCNDVSNLPADVQSIWRPWANGDDLGPIYGKQWRWWWTADGAVDQLQQLVEGIRRAPYSRRHVVCSWNVADLDDMALPPCHGLVWQVHVAEGRLSLHQYQRSADVFIGLPFNIASYALLTMLLARVTGFEPGEVVLSIGDAHLYDNHLDQAREQLSRTPRHMPQVIVSPDLQSLDGFKASHVDLLHYDPHPKINAPIAV